MNQLDQFGRSQLTNILLDVRDQKLDLVRAREQIDKIYYLCINAYTHYIVRN